MTIFLERLIKYFLKYLIRIVQIIIFSILILASLYLIYSSLKFTYFTITDIDLKGDLLVKGIPIITFFLIIGSLFLFIFGIKIYYLLCSVFLMIVNGSLGDIIELLNITKRNDNYSGCLILKKGSMGEVLDANQHTRKYFLMRWWKRF